MDSGQLAVEDFITSVGADKTDAAKLRKAIKHKGKKSFYDEAKETYGDKLDAIRANKQAAYPARMGRWRLLDTLPLSQSSPKLENEQDKKDIYGTDWKESDYNIRGTAFPKKNTIILLDSRRETIEHELTHTLPKLTKKESIGLPAPQKTSEFVDDLKLGVHIKNMKTRPNNWTREDYNYTGRNILNVMEASARAVPIAREYFRSTGKTIESRSDWKKAVRRSMHLSKGEKRAMRRSKVTGLFGETLY
jgi:hypothetical protein